MEDWMIYALIALVLGGYFFIGHLLYRSIFQTSKKTKYAVVDQMDPFFNPSWQWYQSIPKEDVIIKAYDQTSLHGVLIPSLEKSSNQLVLILHGYHSNKEDMIVVAKMYSDLGFKVLLIDQRGHGLSQGNFTSFGLYERYDLRKWINYCLRIYGYHHKIVLHGVSMGAATVLMTAGMEIPSQIKLLVCDSPYDKAISTLRRHKLLRWLILFFPAMHFFTFWNHRFVLHQANIRSYTKKITTPTIFIHGDQDHVTPIKMMKHLMMSMNHASTHPYIVPGAKHGKGYVVDKEGLDQFVLDRLVQYVDVKRPKTKKER